MLLNFFFLKMGVMAEWESNLFLVIQFVYRVWKRMR